MTSSPEAGSSRSRRPGRAAPPPRASNSAKCWHRRKRPCPAPCRPASRSTRTSCRAPTRRSTTRKRPSPAWRPSTRPPCASAMKTRPRARHCRPRSWARALRPAPMCRCRAWLPRALPGAISSRSACCWRPSCSARPACCSSRWARWPSCCATTTSSRATARRSTRWWRNSPASRACASSTPAANCWPSLTARTAAVNRARSARSHPG